MTNGAINSSIFVTNQDLPHSDQDGTIDKPFQDLEDALERAYELSGTFLKSSNVTILMLSSENYGNNHYLLRNKRQLYRPLIDNKKASRWRITIKPYGDQ